MLNGSARAIPMDSTEVVPRELSARESLRRSLNSQMELWAHDVAPFGKALNLSPKSMLLAEAFGEAAGGDFESAMKMGFVIAISSMFGLA